MLKKNNKGFMMAEVIIVSVILAVILVGLFTSINKLETAYNNRNTFFDVDSLYIAIELNDILKRNSVDVKTNKNINGINDITKFSDFYTYSTGSSFKAYLINCDSLSLENLKSQNSNVTFSEFVSFLQNRIVFDNNYYMIIVERTETNSQNNRLQDSYYHFLRLKY